MIFYGKNFYKKFISIIINKIYHYKKFLSYIQEKILLKISPSYRNQIKIINNLEELLKDKQPNSPLLRNIQKQINASVLHQKVFPKYKNIYQDHDIVLVATGATVKYYKYMESAIHIGVNRSFMIHGIELDYLFVADYGASFSSPACAAEYLHQLDEHNHADMKIFYGILDSDIKTSWIIPESIALKHKVERYYALSTYRYPPFRGVLHLESEMIPDNGSISFAAFQFALFTNPKRIFLVGCDTALTGYFDGQSQPYSYDQTHIISGWKQMRKFASIYYPDTEIVSINPVGLKGIFKDIFTDEYTIEKGK